MSGGLRCANPYGLLRHSSVSAKLWSIYSVIEISVSGRCVVLELAQPVQGPDIGALIEDLARSVIFFPALGKEAVSESITNGINSVDNL